MAICNVFPVINLSATGRRIERSRKAAGLTVRDVQTYFGFEYPQAVYKWQHGECLPSVDNLLALSRLLQVPMEDLLVYEDQEVPLVFGTNAEEMSRTWPLENEPFRKMRGAVFYQGLSEAGSGSALKKMCAQSYVRCDWLRMRPGGGALVCPC